MLLQVEPACEEEIIGFSCIVELAGGKATCPKRNCIRGSSNNLWIWSMDEELLGSMPILFISADKIWNYANWLLQSIVHFRLHVFFALHYSFPLDLYDRKGFIRKDKKYVRRVFSRLQNQPYKNLEVPKYFWWIYIKIAFNHKNSHAVFPRTFSSLSAYSR